MNEPLVQPPVERLELTDSFAGCQCVSKQQQQQQQ